MENPTLSRQPNMVSKKSYNGATTASSKSIYDDVFGGAPKFGPPSLSPRVEDYTEIFGGFHTSRASSIPVLDLPLVDDEADDAYFDVRSSGFDYTEVFGGFSGQDFAVSFEDLMMMMEQSNVHDDSSDEAWTPAEAENLSEESDNSIKGRSFSNGDSSYSIDGCMEFNISYSKVSAKCNEDFSNGISHTTQLHDVSGYTFVVDKASSLPNSDYLYGRDDNDHHIIDYSGEMFSTRHLRKVTSQPIGCSTGELFFDDVVPHREFVRNGSTFLTISDVSLKTRPSGLPPPSRPPPALDVEKGYSDKTTSSCRSVVSEESAGDGSPPYFDVEVDASSSAAASAAAMKDAMKKAQAKLKSAKESIERKHGAFHSRTNSDSKNGKRNKEEKANKLVNGARSMKGVGGGLGSIQGGEENGIEFSITKEKHKLIKTSQIISDSFEGNYRLNMAKKSADENEGRESLSSQESDFIDVSGEWKEATQFFELVTSKSKKVFDQESNKIAVEYDSNFYEQQKKEKRETVEGLQGHQGNGVKVGAGREQEHPDKSFERSEGANKQKIIDKRVPVTDEICREEWHEKKFSTDLQPGETEKRRTRAYNLPNQSDFVEGIEKASRNIMKHKDKGSQWKEDNRSMGNVKNYPHGKEESDRRSRHPFELAENEKKFNVTFDPVENEIRLKKVTLRGEKEETKKDLREQEEKEKILRESVWQKESGRRQKEALEKEENERRMNENLENEERHKRQREATEREENEKRQKDTREREETKKNRRELLEREANERRLKDVKDKEENGRRLKENLEKEEWLRRQRKAIEQEENAKREREENEKRLIQALEKEEMQRQREATLKEEKANKERLVNEKRLKQALEKEEMQSRQREASEQENAKREREENEMRLNKALGKEENKRRQAAVYQQKNEKKHEEVFTTEKYEKQQLEASVLRCKEAFEREEIADRIKEAFKSEPGERLEEVCQIPDNDTTSRNLEGIEEIETEIKTDREPEEAGSISEATCEWKEIKTKHVDAIDREKKTEFRMGEGYIELNQVSRLNNTEIDKTAKVTGKLESRSEVEATKEVAGEGTSRLLSDPRNREEEATSDPEQQTSEKIKRCSQVNLDTGNQGVKIPLERIDLLSDCAVKEPVETGRKIKGAQPVTEVEGSNQRVYQQVHASHSTEQKGKNDTFLKEDRESERMKRERDLQLERLRKMEEEREREREREKDRMAVDRTILETRERVYAEARERAAVERATAEVRQRALNDARERLEKACTEAREKSFPDNKATAESRIRAERVAVERATAEARERAFEKAMAERTAFEARDRVERSASDNFSSSRNSGIRPNSATFELHRQQSQGACISNGSKYQNFSVYSERYGVEGESPQRCKARLERHRRTAERAANALEELNMRDRHAQREQAERNRLAETLDADVKRWSSGKEGNLRALLSTLQYILGPDSGWHPIPLTEVITAAAVKKAFRKATLCVHPDKLQQRGATIQQKYICEKVFDLLKEAWNRFNSEER